MRSGYINRKSTEELTLPVYPMQCPNCGHHFDRFARSVDQRNDEVICEKCKSIMRRQPTAAAADYWYGAAGLTRHKDGELF